MQRAMKKYYGISKPKEIDNYAKKKWGEYAGYAQQYLYCAIRGV
jgi:3-methyladenine DNA glycosylase/8-oxoguanine DNA glycosylase